MTETSKTILDFINTHPRTKELYLEGAYYQAVIQAQDRLNLKLSSSEFHELIYELRKQHYLDFAPI